jgi:hypothetical protein
MQSLTPLSEVNGLLHVISVEGLHLVCVVSGVLGALLMFAVFFIRRGARVDGQA